MRICATQFFEWAFALCSDGKPSSVIRAWPALDIYKRIPDISLPTGGSCV